jgi:putative lipoic acid-binding regulatory protein
MVRNIVYLIQKKQLLLLFAALLSFCFSFSQSSIFPSTSVPATPAATDGSAIETGVKFRSTQAGYITGIRFYKGAANTGTHIGHLWSSTGTKLGEVTFTGETASGWQQMLFTTPVAIAANTTYVASYFSSAGYYAITNPYFTAATVNGTLTALANGTDGGNGVYIYTTTSAFPNNTYQTSNYWVDIVFTTTITPDTTPPTINLTAPAAGNVSGIVNITASASDNIGVAGVQFLLNGASLGAEVTTAPYAYSWNTTSLANGTYTLTARARDAAGNTTTSAGVVVTVNNVPDTQGPTVSITAPAAGTVTGTVSVTANASDNTGVAGVQFLLNGVNLGTEDVASPYSISWNTASAVNGTYTLTARARDAAGNITTSAGVVVTVNNVTLLVALPLNEGAGTAAADISGSNHPGTLVNTPTWGAGKYGQGLTFNGTSNYINIPDHADFTLDPAQSYTWSAWVKNNNFNEWMTVWSQTVDANNFFYFYAHTSTDPDGGPVTNGISAYWWNSGGTNKVGVHSNNNVLTAGVWSHITVTYDASQAQNNRFTIYVNGVDVTARADVSSTGTLAAINPTNIRIGSNQPFGEYLNGSVDEIRFYKRLLSAGEVVTDMNTALSPDAVAPTVDITAPVAGNVTATISVTANASDNAGVVGVQFLLDGINLGTEDLASPYSISWNTATATNGTHTLTARARDAAGNITTSAGVVVTVNNDTQVPAVNITAPAAGTVLGTINVSANASDNIGVAGVQFLLDGVNLGAESLVAPYTVSWNTATVADGSHTLTARARDAAGNSATSSAVIVTVQNNPPDTQVPTISITAPAAGNVSGTISVTANASDNVGVAGVQFLLNGVNLGTEDITSPYSISWGTITVANGTYTLTARARDAAGNTATSAGVIVTVNNDTQVPTVSITAPAGGTVLGTINVNANAADNIGVVGVQFLLDGVNLGSEDLASPYTISWNTATVADGSHTLTARARDAAGNIATSSAVVVTVQNTPPDTQVPTVSITAPATGNVTGTINVTANASDNVGVAGVQFLLNGVNLSAEDVVSPYAVSWSTASVANGTYTLTARARDAAGNSATSSPVSVTVFNNSTLIVALNLNEGTGTAAADVSGNNHPGTLINTPAWTTGKYGQGVSLNGTSTYINIADHADFTLDPAQSYTWSTWVKNTNFNEWSTLWSQTVDANNFFYFYAHTTTDPDGGPVTNGISAYWWANGGTNKVGVHSNNNVLTAGVWSYVAVTYDASQVQANRFTIYVNGVDVTARGDVSSTGTLPSINPTNVRIGSNQPFGEYLNAAVDEVRFYKRLLSAAEVTADMNSPIANGIFPTVNPVNGATGVSTTAPVTAVFNVAMDAATINSSTVELRNSSNALIASTVSYNSTNRTMTLTPTAALGTTAVYTAKIKGGAAGVKDAIGSTMTNDYVWSFTTVDPPLLAPTEGPGGPILVVSTTTNPFSRYAVEILRAEGLNEFAAADISAVTSTTLNSYDVVVMGEMTVTAAQVTMFTNWVNAGGTLIAFRPSSLLLPLMGLSSSTGTLSDRYLLVNTASGAGVGIVNQTIQFHGPANLHTLSGATSLATLYSAASTATTNPAVTIINAGAGKAVAFTYDLAKSIVYTRQGNPAQAATETDGQSPIRPDDLFYPGYVDLNKVAIPQADEQQRLLANIIIQSNLAKKPLPRFWYMPKEYKAALIYALDDHGTSTGTPNIFDKMIANSPAGCSVDNWECLRATSWFYNSIPLTNQEAVSYYSQGFDMGVHVQNNCTNFTSFANLDANYITQLQQFQTKYPGLPAQTAHRFHCLVWSDWLTQAKVELSHGMRLSLDYYYWPPSWANGRPGMFTGSGIPMRFADTDGSMIDVYQGVSQLVNENGIAYDVDVNTVLDNALGSQGYYGIFGTHDDYRDETYSNTTIASAKARNVPIITAKQALTWLDGRNNSYFGSMSWNNNQLSFTIFARSGAANLRGMLPVNAATGQLSSITMNGSPVSYTTQTIKGIQYAFFAAAIGSNAYVATYSSLLTRVAGQTTATEAAVENVFAKPSPESSAEKLEVRVMPNPSSDYFNLVISSNNVSPVTVRVLDVFGQSVEKYEKIVSSGSVRIGQTLTGGTYFAEVIQGDQRKVVKLVKTN